MRKRSHAHTYARFRCPALFTRFFCILFLFLALLLSIFLSLRFLRSLDPFLTFPYLFFPFLSFPFLSFAPRPNSFLLLAGLLAAADGARLTRAVATPRANHATYTEMTHRRSTFAVSNLHQPGRSSSGALTDARITGDDHVC